MGGKGDVIASYLTIQLPDYLQDKVRDVQEQYIRLSADKSALGNALETAVERLAAREKEHLAHTAQQQQQQQDLHEAAVRRLQALLEDQASDARKHRAQLEADLVRLRVVKDAEVRGAGKVLTLLWCFLPVQELCSHHVRAALSHSRRGSPFCNTG